MKQQLYTKNEKGRYEPYVEPKVYSNDTYYRRLANGKYEAVGSFEKADAFTEGIWVVTNHRGSTGFRNGEYLVKNYGADKISELEPIGITNFAQLGWLDKIAEEAVQEVREDGCNVYDLFKKRLAYVLKELNKQSK